MPDLPDNNQQTLFSTTCDVSHGLFEPTIDRMKAAFAKTTCENPLRENIVTCKDSELDKFINEVDGLAFDTMLPAINTPLPLHIPILDVGTAKLSYSAIPIGIGMLGMTIGDVISKGTKFHAGTLQEQASVEFRMTLLTGNALKGKDVILFNSGPDTLLEMLWHQRKKISLFEKLGIMKFSYATGMNFSVMPGECPVGQRLNQKKSLVSAGILSELGLPSMPHVYAIDEYDINDWVTYLKNNQHIRIVSMNCQLQKSIADKATVIRAVTSIITQVPYIHFILVGFPLIEMSKFGPFLDNIHFADRKAAKEAQMHHKIYIDPESLQMRHSYSTDSISQILYHNLNQQRIYTEVMKKKALNRYIISPEITHLIRSTFEAQELAIYL